RASCATSTSRAPATDRSSASATASTRTASYRSRSPIWRAASRATSPWRLRERARLRLLALAGEPAAQPVGAVFQKVGVAAGVGRIEEDAVAAHAAVEGRLPGAVEAGSPWRPLPGGHRAPVAAPGARDGVAGEIAPLPGAAVEEVALVQRRVGLEQTGLHVVLCEDKQRRTALADLAHRTVPDLGREEAFVAP